MSPVCDFIDPGGSPGYSFYDSTVQGYNISYDYVAEWAPTIEIQLLKGGLRLAHILNSIYDCNNE